MSWAGHGLVLSRGGTDVGDLPQMSSSTFHSFANGYMGNDDRLDGRPLTLFIWPMFKTANAVQIKVSLDEISPGVWRRLILPVCGMGMSRS
jgi:hypothetical protein